MQVIPQIAIKLCTTKNRKTCQEGVGTANENKIETPTKNQNMLMKFRNGKAKIDRKTFNSPPHLCIR